VGKWPEKGGEGCGSMLGAIRCLILPCGSLSSSKLRKLGERGGGERKKRKEEEKFESSYDSTFPSSHRGRAFNNRTIMGGGRERKEGGGKHPPIFV